MKILISILSTFVTFISLNVFAGTFKDHTESCNATAKTAIIKHIQGDSLLNLKPMETQPFSAGLKVYIATTRPAPLPDGRVGFRGISMWYVIVREEGWSAGGEPVCTEETIIHVDTAV